MADNTNSGIPAKIIDVNSLSYLYGKLRGNIDSFQDASQTNIEQFKLDAQTDIDAAVANANIKAAAAQSAADAANDLIYGAQSDFATKTELNAAISKITSFEMTVVNALPDTGQKGYIYLIMADDGSGNDIYDEYIWIPDKTKFEKIGTTRVDLTPYATTEEVANEYTTKADAAATYLSKSNAESVYLNKEDASSTYATKANVYNEYLQKDDAADTYVAQTAYDEKIAALEKADTDNLTAAKLDAQANYATKTSVNEKVAALEVVDNEIKETAANNLATLQQADEDNLAAAKADAASKYVTKTDYDTEVAALQQVDANNLAAAKSYAESQASSALSSAKTDAASKYVTITDYDTEVAALEKADTDNLATAKSYTDTQDATNLATAKTYAENQASSALSSAKTDAASKYVTKTDYDTEVAALEKADTDNLATAKSYADGKASTALSSAKSYADTQDATNLASAKSYAESQASSALSSAKTDAANTYLSKTSASSTYLTKTDASNTYTTKTDFNSLKSTVSGITSFELTVVTSLPSTGVKGTIYLISASDGSGNDVYDEYIWVPSTSKFEKIGTTRIDLTPYLTKTSAASTYLGISATAAAATKLATARTINGTSFDGTGNITTANWGTARNIYIADSDGTNTGAAVSVNGSGNATLKLPATIKASLSGNASTSSSCSGNAATATKLATARTIALTGSVTGSGTFDGSGNLSIATTTNHTHSYLPLSGGTLTGGVEFSNLTTGTRGITGTVGDNDYWRIVGGATATNAGYLEIATADDGNEPIYVRQYSSGKFVTLGRTATLLDASGNTSFPGTVSAPTFSGALSGNASTATKLATARTIALTGSVTGSGTFDGSGNLSIATTTNHTHSYLPLSGGTMTGTITSSKTTNTYLAGNQGAAIINSTASAGSYTMLAKMNSTNGYFTEGAYQGTYLLQYTAASTVTAGTNSVTKSVTLLNESGNSTFPGTVSAPTFSGALSGNASTATTLQTARTINGTSFNGSANITTANWGTARNIYIADSAGSNTGAAVSVNGSGNVTLKLPATIKASLTGNASTASTLATSRTISLTNAVTGSVSFNGGSNVSITAKVNKGTSAPSSLAEGSVYFVYEA